MAYSYPSLPSKPKRAHFQRLLWRAGFSGSSDQITHLVRLGLADSISALVKPPHHRHTLAGPDPTDGHQALDPINHWGHDCLWWLDRMVRSRNQLVERMTLNLHDLFATSNAGVGNTRHMLRQNRLLRRHAIGELPRPARADHDRPGHAAVAERRRLEQVGAQRELRARGDGAVLPGQRPQPGVAHATGSGRTPQCTPRTTSTRRRGP